jgi:hypothetical protein
MFVFPPLPAHMVIFQNCFKGRREAARKFAYKFRFKPFKNIFFTRDRIVSLRVEIQTSPRAVFKIFPF